MQRVDRGRVGSAGLTRMRGLLACVLMLVSVCALARSPDLRIHGSNTVGERLMPELLQAWLAARGHGPLQRQSLALDELLLSASGSEGEFTLELHAHGSSTGFTDLIAGRADLAMASRPISAGERAALAARGVDVEEAVIALDGLAVIVHPGQSVQQLQLDTLRRVFAGEIRDWSQLGGRPGRIALHARDQRSGTWDTFRSLVLGSRSLAAEARRYESTDALAAEVARDPNAIGFVGLAGMRGVRALAIADGAAALRPEPREVAVEDYLLARRLYLYAPRPLRADIDQLLRFVQSEEGQVIVEQVGFVAQHVRAFATDLPARAPQPYRELVSGAQRLSLNLRFDEGSAKLDSKAEVDLQRLAAYLRAPERARREVILIGFADASEIAPLQAEFLSNDRADHVADRMAALGLRADRVRGLGGSLPLSIDDSPAGRARNRRVEVWVR